jgi:UDP-2-acetamido-3-amino-2,3-dideoxy-glucuronate N-acetyltransferase
VIDPTARIHPTADIEAGVSVGAGSSVWHRAQVRAGARIGAECIVGRDAFIDEGVTIGHRVKIQNAALVYHGVTVEDGVFIGPNAILTNDRFPRAITRSGELARADDWTVSPILLRRGCSIGAGAVVVAGTVVGRFATVGAGAVVTRDVPDHALVAGNPARRLGWACFCGQRLRDASGPVGAAPVGGAPVPGDFAGDAACPACGTRFRIADDACVAVPTEPVS